MILCGTKNGSSMGLLEEPFEELIVKSVPPLLPLGYLMFSTNIVLSSGLQKGYGVVEYQGPNNWQIKIRSKHG